MISALALLLLVADIDPPTIEYGCNEGAIALFTSVLPRAGSTLEPGKHSLLFSAGGYLGLEAHGYQRLVLQDTGDGKRTSMTLQLTPA